MSVKDAEGLLALWCAGQPIGDLRQWRDAMHVLMRELANARALRETEAGIKLNAATAEIARLRGWLTNDAECPCCQEYVTCSAGCTFETDAPGEAARMKQVRFVLAGAYPGERRT